MRTICDVCESAAAILFCAADEAALCRACDNKVNIYFDVYICMRLSWGCYWFALKISMNHLLDLMVFGFDCKVFVRDLISVNYVLALSLTIGGR